MNTVRGWGAAAVGSLMRFCRTVSGSGARPLAELGGLMLFLPALLSKANSLCCAVAASTSAPAPSLLWVSIFALRVGLGSSRQGPEEEA